MTGQTTLRRPAEPHLLPDLQPLRLLPERCYRAHHLVAGNKWILRHAPFVLEHREIRMADATVSYIDLDLLRPEFSRVKAKRLECGF